MAASTLAVLATVAVTSTCAADTASVPRCVADGSTGFEKLATVVFYRFEDAVFFFWWGSCDHGTWNLCWTKRQKQKDVSRGQGLLLARVLGDQHARRAPRKRRVPKGRHQVCRHLVRGGPAERAVSHNVTLRDSGEVMVVC